MNRLGIDIDGVMADFNLAFSRVAESMGIGYEVETHNCYEWDWPRKQQKWSDRQLNQVWERVYNTPNWWMSLPRLASEHDIAMINTYLRSGIEISFITSRRGTLGMSVREQAEHWLRGIGIETSRVENIIASRHKGLICKGLDLHAFLDDAPHNLDDIFNKSMTRAVALSQPYNAGWSQTVDSISQFLSDYA